MPSSADICSPRILPNTQIIPFRSSTPSPCSCPAFSLSLAVLDSLLSRTCTATCTVLMLGSPAHTSRRPASTARNTLAKTLTDNSSFSLVNLRVPIVWIRPPRHESPQTSTRILSTGLSHRDDSFTSFRTGGGGGASLAVCSRSDPPPPLEVVPWVRDP